MKGVVIAVVATVLMAVSPVCSQNAFSQADSAQATGSYPAGMVPVLVKRVAPVYPEEALEGARMSGDVMLEAKVDRNGNVISVSGRGNQILLRAAIAAVKQWKYEWRPDPHVSPDPKVSRTARPVLISSKSPCDIDVSSLPCLAANAGRNSPRTETAPAFAHRNPNQVEITLVFSPGR